MWLHFMLKLLHKYIICVIYVDDTIFFAKTQSIIDDMIKNLRKSFELTDEGNVEAFLGIQVTHHTNGTIEMSQPALIDKVIQSIGLEHDSRNKSTTRIK